MHHWKKRREKALRGGVLAMGLGCLSLFAAVPVMAAQPSTDRTVSDRAAQQAEAVEVQRQIGREDEAADDGAPPEEGRTPADAMATVVPTKFVLDGTWPVPEAAVETLLAPHIGRPQTFSDLELAALDVTRYLRQRGFFVATAYLPAQDFAFGRIHLAVLPGFYGDVRIENHTGISERVIRRELGVRSGEMIERGALERGLLLVSDLARADGRSFLRSGQTTGTSALAVDVSRKGKDFWGYAGYDNGGYRYTGRYQYSLFLNYADPFRAGDLLSLGAVTSSDFDETWSGTLSYQAPLLWQGLRAGVALGRSRYALSGPFGELDYTGRADTYGLWLRQTLRRSKRSNAYLTVRYDYKDLEDETGLYELHNPRHESNWTFTLSGDSEDRAFSGGRNTFSLGYTVGNLSLDDALEREIDQDSTRSEGRFGKMFLSLSRLQRVTDHLSLYLSYERQWADENLDSAEKLSLGGPYGVRAYPEGEASGDEGWLWTTELRYLVPQKEGAADTWQLIAFADGGHVKLYRHPWEGYQGEGGRSLYGAGIGVNWSRKEEWMGRIHYAWRIGPEHAQSESDRHGRLWFQLFRLF